METLETFKPLFNLAFFVGIGALVGYKLGEMAKGRSQLGAWLGAFLFFFGWAAIFLFQDHRPKCPECRSAVPPGAKKCARCGSQLSAALVAFLLLVAAPALAQIEAKEISEEEASKAASSTATAPGSMASPMLLEVPLKTKSGTNVLQFLRTMSEVWRTTETAAYVVDRARVTGIEVRKLKAKKGRMRIGIDAGLSTEWFRQDIDLTLALVAGGREIAKRTWDDLTIGNDAGALLTFGS
jgi:hypothetical protein